MRMSGPGLALFRGTVLLLAMASVCPPAHAVDHDHDGDALITPADAEHFAGCLSGPDVSGPVACLTTHDADQDGDVDLHDAASFQCAFGTVVGPVRSELAGTTLGEYPYFDFVQTFNQDQTVEVGIDPTRFGELVDTTADLFVVAGRTKSEWDADRSLIDVRTGGPQAITLSGTDIQSNTFVVAVPGELDADAGVGLGVGYDIVVDVNRNAVLDTGDLVDGRDDSGGFYVVHDITLPGPLAVTYADYSGGAWLGQRTWYPIEIASLEPLPLVVISHGNTFQYTWYDYLQEHLASYGYVVMSHENNTGAGIDAASQTTLENTAYFLENLDSIAGGVFAGHVDATRIVFIGHSRGGEGVALAANRLYTGDWSCAAYGYEDLVLVSSIAPTDFVGPDDFQESAASDPRDVVYHILYGSADGDVMGLPGGGISAPFNVYERARRYRQSTYIHGADHSDFNCCGSNDFDGPAETEIGREEAQRVAKGTYLALLKYYVEGADAGREYLWRPYQQLNPVGVADTTIVVREFIEDPGPGCFVIDDFQNPDPTAPESTPTDPTISSSGGTVTVEVRNAYENQLKDRDCTYTWSTSDPLSGMTRARWQDDTRGMIFDWGPDEPGYVEFEVLPEARDFTQVSYLSFRACQQSRHPLTVATLGDLTFTVMLRDTSGVTSSISIDAYQAGIGEPYQRTGHGDGAGWQNEFETVRIHLTDFLRNGRQLDLSNVEAIRFCFGPGFGADEGRMALDDVQLSTDRPPHGISIHLIGGPPQLIAPDSSYAIFVSIRARREEYVPGSATLHYRYAPEDEFISVPLVEIEAGSFEGTLPPPACGDEVEFYLSAEGTRSGVAVAPARAPRYTYRSAVGEFDVFFEETLDNDPNWSATGAWAFGQPTGAGGDVFGGADPLAGYTGSNVIGYNLAGDYEADMTSQTLTTFAIDCGGRENVHLSQWRWLGVERPTKDLAYIYISNDGADWHRVWQNYDGVYDTAWVHQLFDVSQYADDQPAVYLRWTMGPTDDSGEFGGWNVDDIRLVTLSCEEAENAYCAAVESDRGEQLSTADADLGTPPDAVPIAVDGLLLAQPFTLERGYWHTWSASRPWVQNGCLLVLEVDPDVLTPRQSAQPVLYVNKQVAERVNVGYGSGRLVVIVPGMVESERPMMWFGSPELPERVTAAQIARERQAALDAGIEPFTGSACVDAIELADQDTLRRKSAELVEQYCPDEAGLAAGMLAPRVIVHDEAQRAGESSIVEP